MAAIFSNGGNRWNILAFNFTKRDALSSVYKISMAGHHANSRPIFTHAGHVPYICITLGLSIS
jgi:hypothetical protein